MQDATEHDIADKMHPPSLGMVHNYLFWAIVVVGGTQMLRDPTELNGHSYSCVLHSSYSWQKCVWNKLSDDPEFTVES